MIRLFLSLLIVLASGTCLSPERFQPISVYEVYGWIDGNCIDTGRCLPQK